MTFCNEDTVKVVNPLPENNQHRNMIGVIIGRIESYGRFGDHYMVKFAGRATNIRFLELELNLVPEEKKRQSRPKKSNIGVSK